MLREVSRQVWVWIGTVAGRLGQDLKHSKREISVRKTSYCLGFLSCFLVVFIVSLTGTALQNAPVVFLKLAEGTVGEYDYTITPLYSDLQAIDYTKVYQTLGKSQERVHSPRFVYSTAAVSQASCNKECLKDRGYTCSQNTAAELCLEKCCGRLQDARVFAIDTQKEKNMGLGRTWNLPALYQNQAYMHSSLADELNLYVGQQFYVQFRIDDLSWPLWKQLLNDSNIPVAGSEKYSYLVGVFTLQDVYSDAAGKHSTSIKNSIMIEYKWLMSSLSWNMNPIAPPSMKNSLSTTNPYQVAPMVLLNHPDRINAYKSNVYQSIQDTIVRFGSNTLYKMGFSNLSVNVELLASVQILQVFSLFLGLLINIIVFILCILSVMLIYSLMMVSIETRTFELGIMRMVGMTKWGVIELIVVHALVYAIPSWAVGLIFAGLLNSAISNLFHTFTTIPVPSQLAAGPALIATLLGLLIPLGAAIIPIQSALGYSLHESIDARRSKTEAVKFSIERADYKKISWSSIAVGSGMAIFGFIIYYALPLALISFDIQLLLNIFFGILLAMLAGMVILSLNFQYILEKLVVRLCFFFEKDAIKSVVEKNLVAHRLRNRKTSLMYALSLGFIIFIAVAFNVQIESFKFRLRQQNGVYLKVDLYDGMTQRQVKALEDYVATENQIKSWSWLSFHLNDMDGVDDISIENIGHVYNYQQLLHGVSADFYRPTFKEFLLTNVRSDSKYKIDEELYTEKGSARMIIGSLYKKAIGIKSLDQDFLFRIAGSYFPELARLKPLAIMDLSPSLIFSKFPAISVQDAAVSLPSFVRLSRGGIRSVDDVPMMSLLLEIDQNLPKSERSRIKKNLRNTFANFDETKPTVWDYFDVISPIEIAVQIMNYFFLFSTMVSMSVCFFSLTSSMYANVLEQSKEIGILLSIGVRKGWIYRIYVYEAFVLVISSSFMGIIIGIVIGFTMTLQRQLFTQLPIAFTVPTSLIIAVVVASVVFAVLASFHPTRRMTLKPIVEILRVVT